MDNERQILEKLIKRRRKETFAEKVLNAIMKLERRVVELEMKIKQMELKK